MHCIRTVSYTHLQIMDMTARYCAEMGLSPYYLYRQKNMAGNFENVGYAQPEKAGIYNILIMEEKQTIVACGAGASTKRVWNEQNPDGSYRIERCENIKDVALYIETVSYTHLEQRHEKGSGTGNLSTRLS